MSGSFWRMVELIGYDNVFNNYPINNNNYLVLDYKNQKPKIFVKFNKKAHVMYTEWCKKQYQWMSVV